MLSSCKQPKALINSISKMHLAEEDNHRDVDDNNDVTNVDVEDCDTGRDFDSENC